MTAGENRLGDGEIWACVEITVRDVLLPQIDNEWARTAAIQLIGLANYARKRSLVSEVEVDSAVVAELDQLRADGNSIVAAAWPEDGARDVAGAVARCLAEAVVDDGPDGAAVRGRLRPLVVAQLDAELEEASALLDAFRGRVPDA